MGSLESVARVGMAVGGRGGSRTMERGGGGGGMIEIRSITDAVH